MEYFQLGCSFCRIIFHRIINLITCKKTDEPKPVRHVVVIGLMDSGKSTLLALMAGESLKEIEPTRGFHIKDLQLNRCFLTVKELGGSEKVRKYWEHYFSNQQGVVFAVDGSGDESDLQLAKATFDSSIENPKLSGLPVMLLVTHQDKDSAKSPAEIRQKWQLDDSRYSQVLVCGSSINDITSLKEAFERFADVLLDEVSPSQVSIDN